MKVLLLDIETAPHLAHVWGLFKQNVGLNQIIKSGHMLCWAARFLDEDKMYFRRKGCGVEFLTEIHHLLDKADVVVHYNGKRFDIPTLNKEFVINGMLPPSPYKQVDLLQVVKKQFRFASNKLAHVAVELGLDGKVTHSGHQLWIDCMEGKRGAWEKMEEYNIQDVNLLDELYRKLLPWIPQHPQYVLYQGEDECVCPKCGGAVLKNGKAYTALSVFQRYKCKKCGGHSRGRKNLADRTKILTNIAEG